MWGQSKFFRYSLCLAALIFFSGCTSQTIVEGISQSQATEIVAVFAEAGIAAKMQKQSGAQGGFTVSVRAEQYPQAMVFLHARNLPRREEPTFADTVAQKGFLPNSHDVESLRLDRARAAELEETLRVLPAVRDVRGIVRTTSGGPSSVSVIIQKTFGAEFDTDSVVKIIQKAIPGVLSDAIQVTVVDTPDIQIGSVQGAKLLKKITVSVPLVPFLGMFNVPEGEVSTLALTICVGLVIIAGLGAFLGYWFGYLQKTRAELDAEMEPKFDLKKLPRRTTEGPVGAVVPRIANKE